MEGMSATIVTTGRSGSLTKSPASAKPAILPASRGNPAARKTRPDEMVTGRRRFSAADKLRILIQADQAVAAGRGALGELLRREGLYSSHLAQWRKQRERGALGVARRGRPRKNREDLLKENGRLRRRMAFVEECLWEAERLVCPEKRPSTRTPSEDGWTLRKRILDLAALAARVGAPGYFEKTYSTSMAHKVSRVVK